MAYDILDTDSVATAGVLFTGSLTAQGAVGSTLTTSSIAQSVEGKKAGKWYVEFTCITESGNIDGVGIVSSQGVGLGGFLGNTGGSGIGIFTNSHVVINGAIPSDVNAFSYGAGDTIGVAIDLDNQFIWFNKNGSGVWVGASGTPNPTTTTGGLTISSVLANNCRVYPAMNLSGNGAKFTANFGATSFLGTVPSGFNSGWTNTTFGTYFGTFATTGFNGAINVAAPPSNSKAVSPYVSNVSGILNSVVFSFSIAPPSALEAVIYDNTGTSGLPGNLLANSYSSSATVSGEIFYYFSGPNISAGNTYWVGFMANSFSAGSINSPTLANGIAYNTDLSFPPSNPFGLSPTLSNFRYPLIATLNSSLSSTASSTGNSTASGFTTQYFTTVGSIYGNSSISGVGSELGFSNGTSLGNSSVSGFSPSLAIARGISTVSAIASSNNVGTSRGSSTVYGVGISHVVNNFIASQVSVRTLQFRRGTEAELPGVPNGFPQKNLDVGEIGFTTDSSRVIIGHNPKPGDINYKRLVFPYNNVEVLTENSPKVKELFNDFVKNKHTEAFFPPTLITPNYIGPITYSDVDTNVIPTILPGSNISAVLEYNAFNSNSSTTMENGTLRILASSSNSAISVSNLINGLPSIQFYLSSIQYDTGGNPYFTINIKNLSSASIALYMRRVLIEW